MIKRSRVRVPAGGAGEFSSPGSTFCADSYLTEWSGSTAVTGGLGSGVAQSLDQKAAGSSPGKSREIFFY